ncbi:hypothetical protein K458DRAFT_320036 [Lentithecium fluviatile CBS 122367]|uniref:Thioredoxin domain-containing protein n=1 Tax=Lentithecium fluviatile CBS 122367 TaxID=1168545 RepID=A0A6G1IH91_9PLEO|nr:hypothetical protein K458DRAFT_320036 [Lentithecium fluviatile CBS 122367]
MWPTLVFASLPLLTAAALVQDASRSNFERLLKQHELVLTAFSSDTYEPVRTFSTIFEQVAEKVQTPSILINCDSENELCKEYDINAYPAIRLFKTRSRTDENENETEMTRYRGKRTKEAIKSFVTKNELPTVTDVEPKHLPFFKQIDDIVLIAYLRPDQSKLLDIFHTVAAKHSHSFVFGHVDDVAIADAESLAMPSIVCYKNIDGDNKVLSGHFAEADVEALLETARTNAIGDFSERNMDAYMAKDKLTAYIFTPTEAAARILRHELTPLARKFTKYVTFGITDAVEYAPMAQNFGLMVEEGFPALAVHAPMNDNVFVYRQGRKIEKGVVEAMLTTILQGKAKSGQVFGSEAVMQDGRDGGHDEL